MDLLFYLCLNSTVCDCVDPHREIFKSTRGFSCSSLWVCFTSLRLSCWLLNVALFTCFPLCRSIEARLSVFILFNNLVSGPFFFYLSCAIQLDHLSVCLFCPAFSLLISGKKEGEWRACARTHSCVLGDNSTGAISCAQITAVLWLSSIGFKIKITFSRCTQIVSRGHSPHVTAFIS